MIVEARAAVAHHLDGSPWEVHAFLPDDIGALPCIAVLRPHLSPGEQRLTNAAVTVLIVGRRVGNDDAQAELDQVTDTVIARFGGLNHAVYLESDLIHRLALTDVAPRTVTVSGTDYDAYALTLDATFTAC